MKYSILLILCSIIQVCSAQDLIYKRDKTVLTVTIVTIGSENITYRDYNTPQGPVLSIVKAEVIKIKTEAGKEILIEQGATSSLDKKNIIKIDLFSLTSSKFSVAYERSISPTKTWEIQLGQIGVGEKPDDISQLSGSFLRAGFKFKRSPEYYALRGKSSHILKGSYLKPELVFGTFSEERKVYNSYINPW